MYAASPSGSIDQGVILRDCYIYALDAHQHGLILTPRCDFAQRKADSVHIAGVLDAHEVIREFITHEWKDIGLADADGNPMSSSPLSNTKRTALTKKLFELMKQKYPRYHWLAPLPDSATPLVVDFQLITSCPMVELETYQIAAELVSPFRETISARYAAYMGRIGTPDLHSEEMNALAALAINTVFG